MMGQFQSLLDPATTLGAFLISMLAGILVSFIFGFFTGKTYMKKNTIKMKENNGMINIDSEVTGGVNDK